MCRLTFDPKLCACRFYFAYCEAAFGARYIHDFQITWTKSPDMAEEIGEAATSFSGQQMQASRSPKDPVTQARNLSQPVLMRLPWMTYGIAEFAARLAHRGLLCKVVKGVGVA